MTRRQSWTNHRSVLLSAPITAHLDRGGVMLAPGGGEQHDVAPELDTHAHEQQDGGAQGAGGLPAAVPVQPLLQQPTHPGST